jgi:2'-5' RNA ligase
MAEIAVDVVLLPSEEMADKAIEANRQLLRQCAGVPDKIVLDKENCLPHISLAMGCIVEKDIADIEKVLQTIAKQYSLEQLSVTGIHVGTSSGGEKVSVFRIERTKTLRLLHEEIMQRMAPYFSYDVTADMIFSPPEAGESTLLWIKNYPGKSSFENFFPHITIGYGEIGDLPFGSCEAGTFPIKFTASKLAVCHLGNHCTCRKILASAELKS